MRVCLKTRVSTAICACIKFGFQILHVVKVDCTCQTVKGGSGLDNKANVIHKAMVLKSDKYARL
jgi:hypothetical protein